eukprot:scaffold387333_cov15-Prasinocladus_malaysianus.AAC.1
MPGLACGLIIAPGDLNPEPDDDNHDTLTSYLGTLAQKWFMHRRSATVLRKALTYYGQHA